MVRAAQTADVASIAELYHRVWHATHGPAMPEAERARRDQAAFMARVSDLMPDIVVAEEAGELAGFAAWTGGLLGQIFVDDAYRGTGVAQELLHTAETRMASQGVSVAELHCLVGNIRARRFYERLGWTLTTVQSESVEGDPGDDTRDFWIMQKRVAQ